MGGAAKDSCLGKRLAGTLINRREEKQPWTCWQRACALGEQILTYTALKVSPWSKGITKASHHTCHLTPESHLPPQDVLWSHWDRCGHCPLRCVVRIRRDGLHCDISGDIHGYTWFESSLAALPYWSPLSPQTVLPSAFTHVILHFSLSHLLLLSL